MSDHTPQVPPVVSRRQFLSMLGLTGTAALLPTVVPGAAEAATRKAVKAQVRPSKASKAQPTGKAAPVVASAPVAGPRVLVVIELQGGNDGFSMLVPGDPRFRQLRQRAWLNPKDLTPQADGYSLATGLAPLAAQLAFVEGVGVAQPDLSHSAMLTRWWQGDQDGSGTVRTGFLGRLCDLVAADVAIAGVSLGGGSTPALISERAATVALPDLGSLRELTQDQDQRMRPTLGDLTAGGADAAGLEAVDADLMARARAGLASGLTLLNGLGGITGKGNGYPQNGLGSSLSLARELISLGAGIRVIHIPWGSFDTHTGHQWAHPEQMRQLGAALVAFHNDLVRTGLSQRVLVATTSEFGRRPESNAGGTDHGTASTMALLGPVRPGRHGAPVNFGQLDRAGNVAATVSMNDYYASLARWVGADPTGALHGSGAPLTTLGI